MNEKDYFTFGVKLAAISRGCSDSDLIANDTYVSEVSNSKAANYGAVQQMVCKIASNIFEQADKQDDLLYHMYTKLASAPNWYPELDAYSDAVLNTLATVKKAESIAAHVEYKDDLVKAATVKGFLGKLTGLIGAAAPETIKGLATLAVMTGGLGGGLGWTLGRHTQEDDTENEAIKTKVDYYNSLANEIKRNLKGHTRDTPSAIKHQIEDTLTENII
jgi:hypothetical protein